MNTPRRRPEARYILHAIFIFFSLLAGCGLHPVAAQPAAAEASVICTVYPVYLIARELASGTGLPVRMLLPAELGCPHHYSLTPADVATLETSKRILANGLGFEPFLDRLADSGFGSRILRIAPASLALPVSGDEQPNPHLFTTPAGLSGMIDAAAAALSDAVPSGTAGIMRENASKLRSRMSEIGRDWAETAARLRGVPVVVTHDSLDYIASTMNLSVVARLDSDDEHQHSAHSRLEIEHAIRDRRPVAILTDDVEQPDDIIELGREHKIPVIALSTLTASRAAPPPHALEAAMQSVVAALAPLVPASAPSSIPSPPIGR